MAKTCKTASSLITIAILLVSSVGSAHAFSMAGAAEKMQPHSKSAVAAYAQEGSSEDRGDFLLSKEEVSHIRWCAERYLSYHATDNTYESSAGTRTACVSP